MRRLFFILVFCFVGIKYSTGQTTIASESFENSLTLFSATGAGFTYYTGNSAAADGPASSPFSTFGSYGWGVKNNSGVLTSSVINTSNYNEGIYTSFIFKKGFKRIQLILLDNRTFRSNLKHFENGMTKDTSFHYDLENVPIESGDSTLLGEEQWNWLEIELKRKADIRIIASSTQFGVSYNGYESWANFPRQQEKMLQLIQKTKANGVIFISGDVHYAELSKLNNSLTYPIYDLTASGLTQSWHFAAPNKNRIEGPVMENHFGMLDFNFRKKTIQLQIIDRDKKTRVSYPLKWKDLKFKKD